MGGHGWEQRHMIGLRHFPLGLLKILEQDLLHLDCLHGGRIRWSSSQIYSAMCNPKPAYVEHTFSLSFVNN